MEAWGRPRTFQDIRYLDRASKTGVLEYNEHRLQAMLLMLWVTFFKVLFPQDQRFNRPQDIKWSSLGYRGTVKNIRKKVKGKGNVVPVLNQAPLHEDVLGSGGTAPRILDLGTRRRWVVSFTPRPLYLQGESPWYPWNKRLGGPQSGSGRGGEEKNYQPPPGIEP
jgi:hypothetical protein